MYVLQTIKKLSENYWSPDSQKFESTPWFCAFKGPVSWERLKKFWQQFTELGRTKGRSLFLKFLGAPIVS